MVLLTSSQVNVAISSGIIVLFTTALFLSGYAIQQRTVRHLRAAIRPDNTPQLYLPDRFHDDTTELADGTIIMLDEYNRPVRMKNGRLSIGKGAGPTTSPDDDDKEGEVVIQVKETLPEILGEEGEGAAIVAGEVVSDQEQQVILAVETMTEGGATTISTPKGPDVEESQQQQEEQQQPPTEEGQEKLQQPEPAESSVPNPDDENRKPISRAERRRLIKEEIQRLAQGEQPVYYQRRLW